MRIWESRRVSIIDSTKYIPQRQPREVQLAKPTRQRRLRQRECAQFRLHGGRAARGYGQTR